MKKSVSAVALLAAGIIFAIGFKVGRKSAPSLPPNYEMTVYKANILDLTFEKKSAVLVEAAIRNLGPEGFITDITLDLRFSDGTGFRPALQAIKTETIFRTDGGPLTITRDESLDSIRNTKHLANGEIVRGALVFKVETGGKSLPYRGATFIFILTDNTGGSFTKTVAEGDTEYEIDRRKNR